MSFPFWYNLAPPDLPVAIRNTSTSSNTRDDGRRSGASRGEKRKKAPQEMIYWPWDTLDDTRRAGLSDGVKNTKGLVYLTRELGARKFWEGRYHENRMTEGMREEIVPWPPIREIIHLREDDVFFITGVHLQAAKMLIEHKYQWRFQNAKIMKHLLVHLTEVSGAIKALHKHGYTDPKDFWSVFPAYESGPADSRTYLILVDELTSDVIDGMEGENRSWIFGLKPRLLRVVGIEYPGITVEYRHLMRPIRELFCYWKKEKEKEKEKEEEYSTIKWAFVKLNKRPPRRPPWIP